MIDFETHSPHCLFNNYPVQYRIQKCSVKLSANKMSKMNECLMFKWLPVYKCIKSRHNLEVRSPVQDYEIWGMVSGCVFVFSWEPGTQCYNQQQASLGPTQWLGARRWCDHAPLTHPWSPSEARCRNDIRSSVAQCRGGARPSCLLYISAQPSLGFPAAAPVPGAP